MATRYILGLGNYVRNDDGIGLRIVERINERNLDNGFEAVEVGEDEFQLLTYLREDVQKILVVDCAAMGIARGDYRVFDPEDAVSHKSEKATSTHSGNALRVLRLGTDLHDAVPCVRIMAIQPESLNPEMTLSQTLEAKLDTYVAAAIQEIER